VGGGGRDDEEVDVVGHQVGVLDGRGRGGDGQAPAGLRRRRHPTLADAGAGDDPLVGRIEAGFEVGVGEPGLGEGGADTGDGCGRHAPSGSVVRSQATGSPSRTRSPGRARLPMRKPVKGLSMLTAPPGPSIMPTSCPRRTISPSVVTVWGGRALKRPVAGDTTTRSRTSRRSPG